MNVDLLLASVNFVFSRVQIFGDWFSSSNNIPCLEHLSSGV